VPAKAQERGLDYLDATCPLVSKVHRQAERLVANGQHILFIGHAGHPEVNGTFGQVPEGQMTLVETVADAQTIALAEPEKLAFLTQTTLSVDDTAEIISILMRRFPSIKAPKSEDICYATSNRQAAVKQLAQQCEAVLVIGAPNSSNSVRLVEVAEREGARGRLFGRADEIDLAWLEGVTTLGITAGASAPEVLVREVIDFLALHFDVTEREIDGVEERMVFKLPASLQAA
jgi:4-hydroxy-3-methylbut-2-enyl diphosphate reductase